MALMGQSAADIPTPRVKPANVGLSEILTDQDAKLFQSALRAADRNSWTEVSQYAEALSDTDARDFLIWRLAVENPNADLNTLTHASQTMSDWPRLVTVMAKAEDKLWKTPLPAQRTLSWFIGKDPVSGEGWAALARAHYDTGNMTEGDKWLKKAWRESKLTRDIQQEIFGRYRDRLSAEDHYERADHLIWQGSYHYNKAEALMPFMSEERRRLVDARLRIAKNASGMDGAIDRIPPALRTDPGFLYERGKWRRQKRTKDYALPIYLQVTTPPSSETGQERLWREKKIMAYWAIEEQKFADAYNLTLNHGMTGGASFADAEFLAGWLALTKLGQPKLAAEHFTRLRDNVSYPVSLSRANYWLGRAFQAQSLPDADTHYAAAAQFKNTYYGFLAAERLGPDYDLISLPVESNAAAVKSEFDADRRVKIMRLLGENREEYWFNVFAFHLDDEVESLEKLTLLSNLAREYGYMKPAVRAAKQASRFQDMLTESGYPVPESIVSLGPQFDIPFVLAIARQESEFNTNAISSARAYGMMQMINSTARATARQHGIPYSRSRLLADVDYSAQLGALHLHDLLRRFDGSYIMAAAGYNAGPHRVSQWVDTYGDPRTGEVDPIDWIESLPFSETRNYIQRVLENVQVYRARLNDNAAPNRIDYDLNQGAF